MTVGSVLAAVLIVIAVLLLLPLFLGAAFVIALLGLPFWPIILLVVAAALIIAAIVLLCTSL